MENEKIENNENLRMEILEIVNSKNSGGRSGEIIEIFKRNCENEIDYKTYLVNVTMELIEKGLIDNEKYNTLKKKVDYVKKRKGDYNFQLKKNGFQFLQENGTIVLSEYNEE